MDAINDNDLYLRLKKAINSLEHERHHVQQLQAKMNEPLAIIGMSCYLPGGINNVELFWQALIQQQNIIQPLSDQRWSTHELVNKTPQTAGKMISDKGGFILDHHQFDANFFGISPREAIMMDPQQRLILLDKDFQQIAAVLGVLFSGNFFVPIHLDNPPARISEIIQQANIKCLITTKENALKNNIHNMAIIDPHYVSATEKFSIKRISQQALAYVIYTSGTTGIPKGVAISQRALIGFRIELNEIENVLRKKLLLDEIFVDVQDIHQTKQMIAYCVVSNKDKEKIIDKLSINKNSFAKSVNKININESFHHEKDWFTRKSYRHWMKGQASIDFIKNIFKMEETINSTKNSLPTALTLLQGIQDPALPLPKYRYPSAGGLYPVKCYISIGNSALELPRGYYYFSQLDSTLVQINQNPVSDQNTIFLIADTTYIQSYYPTKWRMFCEVEAGHIFALLNKYLHLSVSTDSLAKKSLSLTDSDEIIAQYQITNAALSDKPIVSFSLFLPQQYSKLSHYHYYDGKTETWIEHETTCEIYSLDQNTKIIKNALGVMVFDHSASFIEVGQFIELLSQSLLQYQIGMCYISHFFVVKNNMIEKCDLGIAFGKISEEMLNSRQVTTTQVNPSEIIQQVYARLKLDLPEYMIPSDFVLLNHLPLSANGKVDRSALPKKKYVVEESGAIITDPFVSQIAEIWKKVLNIPDVTLYQNSDFFGLGGDSLKALEMLSIIQVDLSIKSELKTLFDASALKLFCDQLRVTEMQELLHATEFVTLKNAGYDAPLIILVHPGTGTIDCYLRFAHDFTEHYELIAIQYKNTAFDNLYGLAEYYAKEVMQKFPNKKIHLLGYSLGAYIAFEMAKVFEKENFIYETISLVDALPIYHSEEIFFDVDAESNLFEKVLLEDYGVPQDKLHLYLAYIYERQNALILLCENYLSIGQIHRPIVHFKAASLTPSFKNKCTASQKNHWDNFSTAKVCEYIVDGNHMNIFSHKHIADFRKKFIDYLKS